MSEQKNAAPLKEVWWGDLHSLGKHAAVAEGLELSPEQWGTATWDVGAALLLAMEKKALPVQLTLLESGQCAVTVGKIEGYVAACLPNAAEAVCVALLRWMGIIVHLEKKPLTAYAGASVGSSEGGGLRTELVEKGGGE